MNNEQENAFGNLLLNLQQEIRGLSEKQDIANLLALANNMGAPEEVRQSCLERAMNLMGYRTFEEQRPLGGRFAGLDKM